MHIFDVTSEFQGAFSAPRTATHRIIVHHAADHYPQKSGIEDVRVIARYHLSKGWSGIGYQEVLAEETEGGEIACYIVSRPETMRAHIWGLNDTCFGLSCAEDFKNAIPAQKWQDALVERLIVHARRWPAAVILGHKEAALPGHATACPGGAWDQWKPELLRRVQAGLEQPQPAGDPIWDLWGAAYPLPAELRGWGIPQCWYKNHSWLGAARSFEFYPDQKTSIQTFTGGYVVYEQLAGIATAYHRKKDFV